MLRSVLLSAAAVLGLLSLNACATSTQPTPVAQAPTPEEFDTMVEVLNESAAARAEFVQGCMETESAHSADDLEVLAAFLEVEPSEVASVLCPRMVQALMTGKFSLADIEAMKAGDLSTDLMRRMAPMLKPAGTAT